MTFIDIHSHILPGIDDGAENMEETIKMIRIAINEGIGAIIVTPHYKGGCPEQMRTSVNNAVEKVNNEINKLGLKLQLYKGSEIYYSETSVEGLINNSLLTMAGSRYVLVEFYPMADYQYIFTAIHRLISEGFLPIIAHTERYKFVYDSIERIEELIELGALIQVNASSFLTRRDRRRKKLSRQLLKKRWVHYVSTDAHDDSLRPPLIKKCAKYIAKKSGKDYANELFFKNPMKIINKDYN